MRQFQEVSGQYMENFRKSRHRESLLNGISEDFRLFFAVWNYVKNGIEKE